MARYGKRKPDSKVIITATKQDYESLVSMLYFPEDNSIFKQEKVRITIGLYEMLVFLQVPDVWKLFYRNISLGEILARNQEIMKLLEVKMRNQCNKMALLLLFENLKDIDFT